MGEITQETINTLLELFKKTVGEKGVKLLSNRVSKDLSGRELVYEIASVAMEIYGTKGSYAIMRQLGRELAKSLMEKYPKEMWQSILESALNHLGFAKKIEYGENEAYIVSCVFYEILQSKGLNPIEHAVCWTGWGFIERFVREMKGIKGIKWESRDIEAEKCKFIFLK